MKLYDILDMASGRGKKTVKDAFEFFDFYVAPRLSYNQMMLEQAEFMDEFYRFKISLEMTIERALNFIAFK